MKTTFDLPDEVFRLAKAHAALRGIPMRQYVTEALQEKISAPPNGPLPSTEPQWMKGFGGLSDLQTEHRHVENLIAEAFETIEPEDKE